MYSIHEVNGCKNIILVVMSKILKDYSVTHVINHKTFLKKLKKTSLTENIFLCICDLTHSFGTVCFIGW